MDAPQIADSLKKLFFFEGHRIVFWNDPDQEFIDLVPDLAMDGVEVIDLKDVSLLELKVRLELEDQAGKYLLYSLTPKPARTKTGSWTFGSTAVPFMPTGPAKVLQSCTP